MTDTEFDYYNIPNEIRIPALHERHTLTALEILREAIVSGTDRAAEAKLGFAYNRKEKLEIGEIAPEDGRHNYYNRDLDDIVVQVTVRFPRPEKDSKFAKLEETLIRETDEARIAAAEAELARIDAEEANMAQRKAALQMERAKLQDKIKK